MMAFLRHHLHLLGGSGRRCGGFVLFSSPMHSQVFGRLAHDNLMLLIRLWLHEVLVLQSAVCAARVLLLLGMVLERGAALRGGRVNGCAAGHCLADFGRAEADLVEGHHEQRGHRPQVRGGGELLLLDLLQICGLQGVAGRGQGGLTATVSLALAQLL